MRQALYRISGVDLTSIDPIGVETVQAVLSEYGPDLSRFPTEKQFVQHVSLALHRPTSIMISSGSEWYFTPEQTEMLRK